MMVLFATVRANGAVMGAADHPGDRRGPDPLRLIFATYGWLGADAIWTSFPVTSFINLGLATAYYLQGGWKKARMAVQPCDDETDRRRRATREPGGALNPAG